MVETGNSPDQQEGDAWSRNFDYPGLVKIKFKEYEEEENVIKVQYFKGIGAAY